MAFNPDEYLASKPSFDPDAYLSQKEDKPSKKETPKTSTGEAVAKGFADSATFGFGDEIEGAIGGASRGIKYLAGNTKGDKGFLDAVKTGYKSDRDATRAYDEQLRKDSPIASVGGGLLAAAPALGAKGAISIGNMVGQGALMGYGGSDEEDLVGQAKDTAIGGGISGALGGAAAGISKGVGVIGNSLKDLKTELALKSLGAQKAQMKRLGGEYGDDVAQYAIDNGLINPFKSVSDKQSIAQVLQQKTGDTLQNTRANLPEFDKSSVLNSINSKMNFNPELGVNAARKSQLDTVTADLEKLAIEGKINAKELLDYKTNLYDLARKSNGEENPLKDVLENARRGISESEQSLANSGEYSGALKDYSKIKNIQMLLDNRASQSGNSLIGAGGMAGSVVGGVTGGTPGALLGAIAGNPTMRSKAGEAAALGINAGQKALNIPLMKQLVESGKLDPRIYAYIISRQQ